MIQAQKLTTEISKSQKEAVWELQRDEHEVYLGIKDVWKENILEAYVKSWLKEIEDRVLDFTHKSEKEMLYHLKKQCLPYTSTENKDQLKDTEFQWKYEEDIAVYFTKLHKDQEGLKKVRIRWYDTHNFTQAVDEMYTSQQFGEARIIDCEEKTDADKTCTSCKAHFKEIYSKQTRYNKVTRKK